MSFSAALPVSGRAWRKLTLTELKLLLRTPAAIFWGAGFPIAGWIVIGLIPGTGNPVKAFGGASVQQTYLPIIIAFATIIMGLQFLPVTLVSYRERGILRRMFTTPVTPQALLSAQLILVLGVQVATTALLVILGTGAFSASIGQPLAFIVAFLLLAAAISTLGLLVAAVSFTSKAANAVGGVLFFVLMFLAGLWWPRAEMPAWLRGISDATPGGAGVQAVQDAVAGHWASGLYFGVLAAWVIVGGCARGPGRGARGGRAVPVGGHPAARPGARPPEPLSARELDVLALIARGTSNRDTAARLFISEATVKTHLLHIYAKLGVNDRAAAVAGLERGLLPRATG